MIKTNEFFVLVRFYNHDQIYLYTSDSPNTSQFNPHVFSRSSVTSNCWKFAAVRGVTNIYPQKFNMVHPKNDGFPKPESPIPGCHFQVHVGFRGSILKPPFFVVFFTNAFTG